MAERRQMKMPRNWRKIYSVRLAGVDTPISELTEDELRYALVMAVDALEDLDAEIADYAERAEDRIQLWRSCLPARKTTKRLKKSRRSS